MSNITRTRAVLACALGLSIGASDARGSENAARVERGTAVIDQWRPDQHLYVKGDVGVSAELLDQLERWLDQNGSNWTVVLLNNAEGETFVEVSGARFTGMDAVEHSLGQGLPNRTAFGQSRDPRTGEPNGAWFALFLKERKFSYFGSAAQDKRGLGEAAWQGNLDRPAIAAMRDGGRVVDAVKDTIDNISRRLTEKITAELRAHERSVAAHKAQEERRQRELAQILTEAATILTTARSAADSLRADYPSLPTPLDWLDNGPADARLGRAHALRQNGDASGAQAEAKSAIGEAETMLRMIDEFRRTPPQMDQLAQRLNRLEGQSRGERAKAPLNQAREALQAARATHQVGDRVYREQLRRAHTAADAAQRLIEQAASNARMVQQLSLAAAAATGLSLFLLGLVLVIRRRGVKEQAEALVIEWKKTLREQNSALIDLLERTTLAVGSSRIEAQKRWSGSTLALADNIIRDVDALFIMSGCTGRIVDDAEGLLRPRGIRALENRFRKRPYLAAIRKLRDEPIAFRPQEALEWVVQDDKRVWDKLLGEPGDSEPFRMSFTELLAAFRERVTRAQAGLEELESAAQRVPGLLDNLRTDLATARTVERELAAAAEQDDLFQATPLFDNVFPTIQENLDAAMSLALSDPVGALADPAALAERRLRDARALIAVIETARRKIMPALRAHREQLLAHHLEIDWLGAALDTASAQADDIAARVVETSAVPETAALAERLRGLLESAGALAALAAQRRDIILPALQQTRSELSRVRQALAATLKLDPARLFREEGFEPETCLAAADQQLLALKGAADRGNVDVAESARAETERLNARAAEIITATQTAFDQHQHSLAQRREESARLRGLCPDHEVLIDGMKRTYAAAALALGSGDPAHPRANGTVQDNMLETRDLLAECDAFMERASTVFGEGAILDAAGLLDQAGEAQELISYRLREIAEKHERLENTVASNAQRLDQLGARANEAASSLADPRTMPPTQRQFEQVQEMVARLGTSIAAAGADPFAHADQITSAEELMKHVERGVRSDHELHAEAARSVATARTQLAEAERLASVAAADEHADSPAILQARQQILNLRPAIKGAAADLEIPHQDWAQIDGEADRTANDAARCAAAIRGDLQAAERAAAAIHTAAQSVRSTAGVLGALGLSIVARPGLHEFEQARQALLRGDYSAGQRLAEMAARIAQQELARARAEEARRRRTEEEARERRRRQRAHQEATMSRRRSGSFSGSSGGSGSSSRGGFSMGSGSSRSGFSSRSGASRSGW